MLKGIDVSEWQTGIKYETVAKQIDFVLIREGYRQTQDKYFRVHVDGFKKANVPILGVYHFIYALNIEQAVEEAKSCIKNVEKMGLSKDIYIFSDFEYDTVNNAKRHGITLTANDCQKFTAVFCETIKKAGYKPGIYANSDYCINMYNEGLLKTYPLWYANYSENAPSRKDCIFWQYSSKGQIDGIHGNVDMNIYYETINNSQIIADNGVIVIDPGITAEDIIDVYREWIGLSRSTGTHKVILDLYNKYIREHPGAGRNYQLSVTDAYCAATFSAAFIKLDAVHLIGGVECGVEELVKIAISNNIWEEDGNVTPESGWGIIFNWDDNTQPNDGFSDHVGIVEFCAGGMITTIEGNMSGGVVGRRALRVGDGNIRGYIKPRYDVIQNSMNISDKDIVEILPATLKPENKPINKIPRWVGQVTADILNVRSWAGTENPNIKSYPILKYGNLVDVCDTVTAKDGTAWYYVRIAGKWYGFVSSKYIIKK